ncbi:MAG: S-methyl-5-thioribose-1-phosphate isomerase [Alistipes sp.]|nr:S-methyl-5-thioribose-1-phosphate isomerase [Alistipes sp.]
MEHTSLSHLCTVRLNETHDGVVIVDQTQLPRHEIYLTLTSIEQVWEAIRKLKVRGAPAIGIAAAYGLYLSARNIHADDFATFFRKLQHQGHYLATARPTAVNLFAAIERIERCAQAHTDAPLSQLPDLLRQEADALRNEDAAACHAIGTHALTLLQPGMGLLTHCNAGHLAVSEYGTALAPIYLGQEQGYDFRVFADETRPLLQGARLTAFELQRAGVNVTLICDNMASLVMRRGWIQAVVVGCDRIAANGDTANKIGTSAVAILAHHYGIPFYVLGPTSTIDLHTPTGSAITIEERDPSEITSWGYRHPMAPEGIKVYNPAFDITPAELITAIITEKGIARYPFTELSEWKVNP